MDTFCSQRMSIHVRLLVKGQVKGQRAAKGNLEDSRTGKNIIEFPSWRSAGAAGKNRTTWRQKPYCPVGTTQITPD